MPEWEGTRNYAYFAYVKPAVRSQKNDLWRAPTGPAGRKQL